MVPCTLSNLDNALNSCNIVYVICLATAQLLYTKIVFIKFSCTKTNVKEKHFHMVFRLPEAHQHHHHLRLNVYFLQMHELKRFLWLISNQLSFTSTFLTFHSSITYSLYVFFGSHLDKLPPISYLMKKHFS